MYISDWFPEDEGIVEAFAYLCAPSDKALLSPVMRLRAVRDSNNEYVALIRDPGTGVLLDYDEQTSNLEDAKYRAAVLAHLSFQAAASTPRPRMSYLIGWYKSAPERGSTGTHLVRRTDTECSPICGDEIIDSKNRWVPEPDNPIDCIKCNEKRG